MSGLACQYTSKRVLEPFLRTLSSCANRHFNYTNTAKLAVALFSTTRQLDNRINQQPMRQFSSSTTPEKTLFCTEKEVGEFLKPLMVYKSVFDKVVTAEKSERQKKIYFAAVKGLSYLNLNEITIHNSLVIAVEKVRKREMLSSPDFFDSDTITFINEIEKVMKAALNSDNYQSK